MAKQDSTTSPPRPPSGSIGALTWITEVDQRRGLVGLHALHGNRGDANLSASLWLPPAEAEKLGKALLAAVPSIEGGR
jgi:hypothetical protein